MFNDRQDSDRALSSSFFLQASWPGKEEKRCFRGHPHILRARSRVVHRSEPRPERSVSPPPKKTWSACRVCCFSFHLAYILLAFDRGIHPLRSATAVQSNSSACATLGPAPFVRPGLNAPVSRAIASSNPPAKRPPSNLERRKARSHLAVPRTPPPPPLPLSLSSLDPAPPQLPSRPAQAAQGW